MRLQNHTLTLDKKLSKEADSYNFEIAPPVQLYFVEVFQPDMNDPSGDLRRLREALEREWKLKDLIFNQNLDFSGLSARREQKPKKNLKRPSIMTLKLCFTEKLP